MKIGGYKRLVIVLLAIVAVLIGCLWHLWWEYHIERLDAKLTWNTVVDYDRSRRVDHMNIEETVDALDYAAHLGLRVRNRYLNEIMDREQALVVRDIIEQLRKKTGEDLGDDPEAWIQKFGRYDPASAREMPDNEPSTR